ncbi:MAG: dTDP-4-dehydrorhamnose reductase [Treponema sp.]|jgi:dTDP-4-dehydrorhamnose reductase|nr:dTDP-4-dehydrorhamnose reductase [Treponema sp.]MBQ5645598.1 dTDP-4-dehydrorhamnose reductase [Treponema sp.]MBQ5877102.1 dTDP-4-dehydrorhamnose reductase [Treponema sp.]
MVWLIGCKGMLGTEIARQLKNSNIDYIGTDIDVDITKLEVLEDFANKNPKIDWIINCSAYTAVDKAEDDKDFANLLNNIGPKNISSVAKKINAKMIHISTDYVFDGTGTTPYTEDMDVKPIGVYGQTKADGEKSVIDSGCEYYIFRTAWLYGYDGKNFVYTMLKLMESKQELSVVSDQKGTPTFAGDLANCVIKTITSKNQIPCGIYHCTDLGEITWYDFACEIYKQGKATGKLSNECKINPCSTDEFPTKAKRPAYSVLSKEKIQQALGIALPMWNESLNVFMNSPLFSIK